MLKIRWVDPVEVILVVLSLALCLDVLVAVFFRYVVHYSLGFYDELATYTFVWMSFLGAALGVRRAGHYSVTVFVKRFPEGVQSVVAILVTLGMLAFAVLLVVQGLAMSQLAAGQVSPVMEISQAYLYGAVPVSGALMTFYLVQHLVRQIRGETHPENREV